VQVKVSKEKLLTEIDPGYDCPQRQMIWFNLWETETDMDAKDRCSIFMMKPPYFFPFQDLVWLQSWRERLGAAAITIEGLRVSTGIRERIERSNSFTSPLRN
jgi:hypothetical protein